MFGIRLISTIFRNVSYVWLIHMYSLCKEVLCWERKCVTGMFVFWVVESNNKVGLQIIAEMIKIYSYLHVRKCPYPQDVS